MSSPFVIEDIDEMRRLVGIDDIELRDGIVALGIGDYVNITLRLASNAAPGETLSVRITEIVGHKYRGQLAERPASAGLAMLSVGQAIGFSANHIHSLAKAHQSAEQ